MRKFYLIICLFVFQYGFSQTQVDFFCSNRIYQVIQEKNKDKFTVKIIGFNSQKVVVDMMKTDWDSLSQAVKNDKTIAKLKDKGIIITKDAILDNSKFDNDTKSTTIDFIDTLTYSNLNEVKTPAFSSELSSNFPKRFSPTCSPDFPSLLEMLDLKSRISTSTQSTTKPLAEVLENSFGFAVGLGPSWSRQDTYDYYVSLYDTTLRRDKLNSPSFVASLLVTWNKMATYRRFREGDTDKATGELFRAPSWWGIAVGFNFAEVNPTNMQFNFRLSGGIGALANLGGGFQMGLFYDLTQQRVLRKDLEQYVGKKYPFNDYSNLDTRLFTNQFIPSISLKCIYKFKGNNGERKGIFNDEGKVK